MSMIRNAAFAAALALVAAGPAFAAESENATGNPFAEQIAVTQGQAGAGATGNNASATGDALAQGIATSHGRLSGLPAGAQNG